jgi:CRISPR-associated protein Cas5
MTTEEIKTMSIPNNDVRLLLEPPNFDSTNVLTIEPLMPLSLVVQMPGKFYRSQSEPSSIMIHGMLENALGWHFNEGERKEILKAITKRHKITTPAMESGVGFQSVLQYHIRIGIGLKESEQSLLRYNDYWSQHLRTGGLEFFGGSRGYDARIIPLANAVIAKDISVTDSGGRREEEAVTEFKTGDKINLTALRSYFPRYYVSPTRREYIVPRYAYLYRIETSPHLADILSTALENPEAPLYLGSNEGWVEATWQSLTLSKEEVA